MQRERLKTTTGCDRCKRRRKKCTEEKPVCQACQRLQMRCQYSRRVPVVDINDTGLRLSKSNISGCSTTFSRTADYLRPVHIGQDSYDILQLFTAKSCSSSSACSSDLKSRFESIMVPGFFENAQAALKMLEDSFGSCNDVSKVDKQLQNTGHGSVARLAFIWYFLLLNEVVLLPGLILRDLTIYSICESSRDEYPLRPGVCYRIGFL